MAYRQYIGARYVPKYVGTWDSTKNYEPLTIVDDANGNSYTSTKDVPAGTPLTDRTYWALTGQFSGAILNIQNRMTALEESLAIVTPEKYGAVGDGNTDDSASFNAALENASVLILTQTYNIKNIEVTGQKVLIGGKISVKADGQYYPTLFKGTGSRLELLNVEIEGVGVLTADLVYKKSLFDFANNSEVVIDSCKFTNFGANYNNAVNAPVWDYYAVLFKCVDCSLFSIKNSVIDGVRGDEIAVITPSLDGSVHSEIIMENNIVSNSVGASFNFFANTVVLERNVFRNWNYEGSIFNVMADYAQVEGNVLESNVTAGSFFDGFEGALFKCTTLSLKDNTVDGYVKVFAVSNTINADVTGNNVNCRQFFVGHDQCSINDLFPHSLAYRTPKGNGSIFITGNNVRIQDDSTISNNIMVRLYAHGVAEGDPYPLTAYLQQNAATIVDNVFEYLGTSQVGTVVYANNFMRTLKIEGNSVCDIPETVGGTSGHITLSVMRNDGASRIAQNVSVIENLVQTKTNVTLFEPFNAPAVPLVGVILTGANRLKGQTQMKAIPACYEEIVTITTQ